MTTTPRKITLTDLRRRDAAPPPPAPRTLTVADVVARLAALPQDAPVHVDGDRCTVPVTGVLLDDGAVTFEHAGSWWR